MIFAFFKSFLKMLLETLVNLGVTVVLEKFVYRYIICISMH